MLLLGGGVALMIVHGAAWNMVPVIVGFATVVMTFPVFFPDDEPAAPEWSSAGPFNGGGGGGDGGGAGC